MTPASALMPKTLELLRSCELPLHKIAAESGLGYEWLRKLRAGLIPDPSVNKIQTLHDFLVQHQASAATEAQP